MGARAPFRACLGFTLAFSVALVAPVRAEAPCEICDLWLFELEELEEREANRPSTDFVLALGMRYDRNRTILEQLVSRLAPASLSPVSRFSLSATTLDGPLVQAVPRLEVIDVTSSSSRSSDSVGNLDLFVWDRRKLAGRRLHSELRVYADARTEDSDQNYYEVSFRTGPSFDLSERWTASLGLEGAFSFYGGERLSRLGAGVLSLRRRGGSAIRGVELRSGSEGFSGDLEDADAWFTDLVVELGSDALLVEEDSLRLLPRLTFNRARDERFSYQQAELGLFYSCPLLGPLSGRLETRGWRRLYDGHEPGLEDDRRDWRIGVAGALAWEGILSPAITLELRYEIERRHSNNDLASYNGQSIGLFMIWHP